MSRLMSKKTLVGSLAVAGALGLGIAVPTLAYGYEPAPSGSSALPSSSISEQWKQRHEQRQAAFAEALAKELGLPTDKVTAALEKVREQQRPTDQPSPDPDRAARLKERLAQAVKDGKLTQEQADAITKAAEEGVLPGGGQWGHRNWRGW